LSLQKGVKFENNYHFFPANFGGNGRCDGGGGGSRGFIYITTQPDWIILFDHNLLMKI
jgi:hypothetical protein